MRIIAGAYRGRNLKTTTGPGFRPAMGIVREALFSMLEARGLTWPGARVLDLFAGSGSLGFEALSRGADMVCFVERAPYAAKVIAANAALLRVEENRIRIMQEEAAKALSRRPGAPYSLVFIDPPYEMDILRHTLHSLFQHHWLAPGAFINAELEERRSFAPETAHPRLEALADRTYGQTRVLLWRALAEPGSAGAASLPQARNRAD